MSLKEHLQFLAMLIPTMLLLVAATVSLAFPAGRVGAPEVSGADPFRSERVVMMQTEAGPVATVEVK